MLDEFTSYNRITVIGTAASRVDFRLVALPDQTYTAASTFFDNPVRPDGRQKWVDFIAAFWHVDCVSSLSEDAFIEKYHKWCKRRGYMTVASN